MPALDWLIARPIAHRGLHDKTVGRFENTISAALAAIAGNFAIECDVQLSADGEAMVFHDHELDRLTDATGPVRAQNAAQLGQLRIGGTDDGMPTLTEFLDAIGGRVPLVIEVKSRFDGDERLARRLAEILAGRSEPIAVKSFDPDVVALLRRMAPSLPRGIVAQSRYDGREAAQLGADRVREMTDLLHWERTAPDFLSWRVSDLPAAAPFLGRLLGQVPVMSWTVRNEGAATHAYANADQIVFEGFLPSGPARGIASLHVP
jgi:glycerophosphoryl diester phosphodiesterase